MCILGLNNVKGEQRAIFEDKKKNSQNDVLFGCFRSVISFSLIFCDLLKKQQLSAFKAGW